jgi:hypothetical protein|tara:strand:+ start:877 stop:1158 length:282 start_codon:yes stop_codon:yes gene_type:complete
MAKFKTKGGKTVVHGTEAVGIDDPLLGSGMALGGRSIRKQKANERRKRKRQEKKYERGVSEMASGRGVTLSGKLHPKTIRKQQQRIAKGGSPS